MPISKYFKGHGDQVMKNMQSEYGAKKGKNVFYATANKRKMKPVKRAGGGMIPGATPLKAGASMRGRGVPVTAVKNPYGGMKTASGNPVKIGRGTLKP